MVCKLTYKVKEHVDNFEWSKYGQLPYRNKNRSLQFFSKDKRKPSRIKIGKVTDLWMGNGLNFGMVRFALGFEKKPVMIRFC